MSDRDDGTQRLREHAKRELRTRMRSVRGVLPAAARDTRSRAAIARLAELPEFTRARTWVAFSAIQKELDPAGLVVIGREQSKRVGLPCVMGNELVLREWVAGAERVEGAFGILEPDESAPVIAPMEVDFVLVPGLAFDARGHRIGYGRGFYDRLLPTIPNAFRVGVAYDFQVVPELPDEPHDVAMQCVVSDARTLRL
jgi:5-formyltetrahydrofolate cyclo-ligase